MSAPVCASKWQCTLNGLSGTAVAVSVAVLGWIGFGLLGADLSGRSLGRLLWLWAVPFGPMALSVLYAALMRWQARPLNWFGLSFTIGGAVWGVIMLNAMRSL
ncbi:hypothetical protein [Thalassovita mangrovi]|uniref:Uncharacterized protein n=1 Tax=Thalassovita mangrovi TaxID=2692236 RepID=A0A6L8LJB9_9RHOB|nr:hypothetical protein [Thalassovita mangrovi]MYM56138.1 hypothetical protein [Thalassovita mangrovi]